MAMRLTCYSGVGEIGGNKILLEDGDTRLLLDFGTPFGRHKQYFNEYLGPRVARGLWDLVALDLLPPLKGLYREDLALAGLWERFDCQDLRRVHGPCVDAVLLSHAHLDHIGDVAFLDPEIPLIATAESAVIARAMQVTGQPSFLQEWCYFTQRAWNKERGVLETPRNSPYQTRAFHVLADALPDGLKDWWLESPAQRKELDGPPPALFGGRVRDIQIRWWPVDHSIPGAVAFAVKTSAGWVCYTGDLRFHGRQQKASQCLMEAWAEMDIAVLICEGTRLGDPGQTVGEDEVHDNALRLTRAAAGRLVVADFAARNLERLQTFLQVARETERCLAIQPKDAYLLDSLALVSPPFRDMLQDARVVLYDDVKSRPRPWERTVRERWASRTVGPGEVSRAPGDYILCCSLWDMNDLLDLSPESLADGIYLYANSKAYDEEQAVDLERLRQWVRHLGLRMVGDPDDPDSVPLHASGHASEENLVDLVRAVRPRVLVPVHTERPERWLEILRGTRIAVHLPEEMGQSIPFHGELAKT